MDAATGKVVKRGQPIKNLLFDSALNQLAGGGSANGYGGLFEQCKIGSGTNPNSINSGAVTFTQVGTTITASVAGYFNVANVGGTPIPLNSIIKYGASGSAGAEQYVSAITGGGTTITVAGAGMTVATPTAATIWLVQQTALQTLLFASTTYVTGAGTAFVSNVATMGRIVKFPVQGSVYTVAEIGYANSGVGGATVNGRIVLPAADTVLTSQFYQVTITMTVTQTPGAPTAVPNVGTNINTAGNAMVQAWACDVVNTAGATVGQTNTSILDKPNGVLGAFFALSTVTLNSTISTASNSPAAVSFAIVCNNFSNSGQPVGVGVSTTNYSFTTAGQTCYGIVCGNGNTSFCSNYFAVAFTTPITLPSGSFTGTLSFTITFTRTLVN